MRQTFRPFIKRIKHKAHSRLDFKGDPTDFSHTHCAPADHSWKTR